LIFDPSLSRPNDCLAISHIVLRHLFVVGSRNSWLLTTPRSLSPRPVHLETRLLFDLHETLQGQGTAWHGGKGRGAVKVIAVVLRRRWLHWKRILRQGSGLLSAHPRCLLAVMAAMAGMKSQSSRARASWCIQIAQEAQVLDA
jgi:hypothetical protein